MDREERSVVRYIISAMDRAPAWLGQEMMGDDERRHALAHAQGIPFVVLEPHLIIKDAMLVIPEPIAREHNVLAYDMRDHVLEVALLDLADLEQIAFLETRFRLLPRLTTRAAMIKGLLHYQKHLRDTYGSQLQEAQSPNLLDALLRHAFASGANDVHLENTSAGLSVRYRIRGTLKNAFALPPSAGKNIFGKLRALAGISSGALPHESRLRIDLGSGEDVRVAIQSLPTIAGEKMLLHIVREQARRGWTLSSLGLHGEALERLHHFLNRRRGLLLVEGVGKTTLLYTLLDLLNNPEVALASIEERVLQTLPRVAQVELSALLTPAGALRGVLKTDPDVVMLDPVQGSEMTKLAESASVRGVLVLAATEDVASVEHPDMRVRTAVVRKLCAKKFLDKRKLTRAESDAFEAAGANFAKVLQCLKEEERIGKDVPWKDVQFARAVGCSECEQGYQGTLGLQEVQEGGAIVGLTIVEDGLFKAAQGLTSIEEVLKLVA